MALEDDIKRAIDAELPAQLGQALRARLEQGDEARAQVKSLEIQLNATRVERDHERARRERAEAALVQHGELGKRELALAERERNATIFELKTQLAAQERLSGLMNDVLLGLVRNTEYRTVLTEQKNLVIPGSNGCSTYTNIVTDTKTTTQEAK